MAGFPVIARLADSALSSFGAFGMAALIVPQAGGEQWPAVRAQQGGAMHLPGQTNVAHLAAQTRLEAHEHRA